ncbi:MAG: MarR family winged helix-turn-helix transcriptional regulator [Spirochaetaceae bacterium]
MADNPSQPTGPEAAGERSDLVLKILRTFPHLMRKLLSDFDYRSGRYELNYTQYKSMMLVHYEPSTPLSELGAHMNLERGSFTSVIDGLVAQGLLKRHRDPRDRRRITLELTPEGERFVDEQIGRIHTHIAAKLDALSPEDRRRFLTALDDLFEMTWRL